VDADLFAHGPQSCRACFNGSQADELQFDEWRLVNNPGYYGSSTPSTLILGFSKGANQNRMAARGNFDSIAFANARHRLQAILSRLGLMPADRSIDALMTAQEKEFSVTSLVRCSLSKLQNGKWVTSGNVIPTAFRNKDCSTIIGRCAARHLGELPPNVQTVLLLGNDDRYVRQIRILIHALHPDYFKINDMAFMAGGAVWVHTTHPSPGNGHFNSWINGSPDTAAGRKREMALQALEGHDT